MQCYIKIHSKCRREVLQGKLDWHNMWREKKAYFSSTTLWEQHTMHYSIHRVHSKITMAGDVVPYYTVTALVPTQK